MRSIHYQILVDGSDLSIHPLCRESDFEREETLFTALSTNPSTLVHNPIHILVHKIPKKQNETINGTLINGVCRWNCVKRAGISQIWAVLHVCALESLNEYIGFMQNKAEDRTVEDNLYQRWRLQEKSIQYHGIELRKR